eukprot:gene4713-biopygen12759
MWSWTRRNFFLALMSIFDVRPLESDRALPRTITFQGLTSKMDIYSTQIQAYFPKQALSPWKVKIKPSLINPGTVPQNSRCDIGGPMAVGNSSFRRDLLYTDPIIKYKAIPGNNTQRKIMPQAPPGAP